MRSRMFLCACGTWSALNLSAHWQSKFCPDPKEQNVKLAPVSISIAQDIPI